MTKDTKTPGVEACRTILLANIYERYPLADAAAVYRLAKDIGARRGKTIPQVALNWVISQPEVSVAISGSDTIEQLEENLSAVEWRLDEDEMRRLEEASRPMRAGGGYHPRTSCTIDHSFEMISIVSSQLAKHTQT